MANDDDPLRKSILAHMISVQLLASCFTPPQSMNTLSLPSGWYRTDDNWLNARLVSSLRQHTQWKHSPAFGHQARNNSAASLWPERDDTLSREALLAEHISLNRRLRRREDRAAKESSDTKRRRQSELSDKEPKRRRFSPSRHRRRLEKFEKSSSHRILQRLCGRRSQALSLRGRLEQRNVLKVMRGLRVRNVSENFHRWSLEPVLRIHPHPVFVQPVKDYVMKRWRVFRSGNCNHSPNSAPSEGTEKRPDYQRAASSTSRDSIQLSRRAQIVTMNQGSGTSLGQLAPDAEASWSASAGKTRILKSAEVSKDSTNHAQTTAKSKPLTPIEHSDEEDLSMESTDCFPSAEWTFGRSLQSSESGQTRHRTSTSGTTVYNPPLIAEFSPNSQKLESDGSTSSGTSSEMSYPKFLHEGEMVSASR